MQIAVITPERTVLEADDVAQVVVPAVEGELGILPGHVAMVCCLAVGRIRVDRGQGESLELATSGGFAEVLEDEVTILAETAERAEEIDVARAQRARDKAQEALARAEADDALAGAALSRALNRIRISAEK